MKNGVIVTLVVFFIFAAMGSASAGLEQFADVPADHWAYDAIDKLAAAGLVKGYGNGIPRGDLCRYDMALIVAKAMTRSDKADAQGRILLGKLAAEFAAELSALGIRPDKVQVSPVSPPDRSNLTVSGRFQVRYIALDDEADFDRRVGAMYRFRLNSNIKLADDNQIGLRLVSNSPYQNRLSKIGLLNNVSWTAAGHNSTSPGTSATTSGSVNAAVDRAWFATKLGEVKATIGRQELVAGITTGIIDPDVMSFDGVNFKWKMGAVKTSVNWGRLNDQKDIASVELSAVSGRLKYGVGYFALEDNAGSVTPKQIVLNRNAPPPFRIYGSTINREYLKLWYGNLVYQPNPHLSLISEFSQNKADYATKYNTMYVFAIRAGDQVLVKPGHKNLLLAYYTYGANALAMDEDGRGMSSFDSTPTVTKLKAFDLSYNYAFTSNLFSEVHLTRVTNPDLSIANYQSFRALLTASF